MAADVVLEPVTLSQPELLSGERGGGPITVESLLRQNDPRSTIERFALGAKALIEAADESDYLLHLMHGSLKAKNNLRLEEIPEKLTPESFPVKLFSQKLPYMYVPSSAYGNWGITCQLDFLRSSDDSPIEPYLVTRFRHKTQMGQSIGTGGDTGDVFSLHNEAAAQMLLKLGFPLDVAIWQHYDHPGKFEEPRRWAELLARKPMLHIDGKPQMRVAEEKEISQLPGVVVETNGLVRFYVADPHYTS